MDMKAEKKIDAENKRNTKQKLNMEQFAESIREWLEQQGQFEKVSLQKVLKNNGVVRCGLVLCRGEHNVVPTIYLESFFKAYQDGADIDEIVGEILEAYESAPDEDADMSFFRDFSMVKDMLCMKLVNREANAGLLTKIPYRDFLDMAVVYYVDCDNPQIVAGTIQVYNSHMEMWGVTEEDLWEAASINTPERKPGRIESMEDILAEMLAEQDNGDNEYPGSCMGKSPVTMLVITNTGRLYGDAVILYSGMLRQAADRAGSDLFILPSSLHEVIAVPAMEREDAADLKEIVMAVNRTHLQPEEVLSDNVYIYRRERDRLEIA